MAAAAADVPVQPPDLGVDLRDVLDVLPLNVIHDSIWAQLLGPHSDACTDPDEDDARDAWEQAHTDCSSFKLTCKHSARLVDQLLTCVTYTLNREVAPTEAAAASVASTKPSPPLPISGPILTVTCSEPEEDHSRFELATQRQSRTAFLARLPRLTTVRIEGWCSEEDVVSELKQCIAATQGRVTRLALSGKPVLSLAAMSAVRLACPCLRQLFLEQCGDPSPHLPLGTLFDPLHDAGLTKLTLSVYERKTDPGFLRSLGGMTALQSLDFFTQAPVTDRLHHLAALVQLTHCDIFVQHFSAFTVQEVSPLLSSATQLRTLSLWGLDYEGPGTANPGPVAAALGRLGDLSRLQSLDLGRDFRVDDLAFAALRRLSQLTELACRDIKLKAPAPGRLPSLRRLGVAFGMLVRPAALLLTLLPLLPLPLLEEFNTGFSWSDPACCGLYLHMGHAGGKDAAVEAAALRRLAQHLAAALLLRLSGEVRFGSCCAEELTPAQIKDGMQPLLARFPEVTMKRIELKCGEHKAMLAAMLAALEL